jgi:phytoene dehydrogenase-like protein
MRVGVVGSGLAGLSAACTLAARGHQVDVFEKNDWLGGKAAQLREAGFRFDMGPTILIQPSMLRKIFAEAGRELDDYVPMVRLDPQWRCFFEDGATIDLLDDAAPCPRTWSGASRGWERSTGS